MRISILILFLFLFFSASAQHIEERAGNTSQHTDSSMAFTFVEVMPVLQTKEYSSFGDYVGKNLKYPKDAVARRISGSTYVRFIVEKDGSVSNVSIIPGKELYPSCDQEAIRVISNSPKFKPGMQNGKPVRVKMIQRIAFTLVEEKK